MSNKPSIDIRIGVSRSDNVILDLTKKIKDRKERYLHAFGFWTSLVAKRIAYLGADSMNSTQIDENEIENAVVRLIFVIPTGIAHFTNGRKIGDGVYKFVSDKNDFGKAFVALIQNDIPKTWNRLQKVIDGDKLLKEYYKHVDPVFYIRYENGRASGNKDMNKENYERFYKNIDKIKV